MSSTDSTPTTLLERIDQLPELKPFPVVATKVLEATNNPNTGPADLIKILQCDPSISLRLLKVANSSIYGFGGEIRSVDQAVVILGLRAVRDMVVTAAAADLFAAGDAARQSREQLWDHSLACATVASILSVHTNVSKEEAFLAGILHDVGKLIFYDLIPDEYDDVIREAHSGSIITCESDVFGVNHQEIGNRCSSEWGLPPEINDAISFHHSPLEAEDASELVNLIGLADSLSHAWCLGKGKKRDEDLDTILEHNQLELAPDVLAAAEQQAVEEFEMIRKTFSA